jgi:hypothetical protein
MKHNNVGTYYFLHWNWSCLCDDDVFFVASCTKCVLEREMLWPNVEERCCFDTINHNFPGCIGLIDGTLVYIERKKTHYIPNDL